MPENAIEFQLFREDGQKVSAEEIKYKPRLVLGLDVGIASVGYALLDFTEEKIITLGSYLFELGENPKDGASLAEPRRTKRGQRRRLERRRRRLSGLRNMFQEAGLIDDKKLETHTATALADPWELRVAALERKLSGEDLARCLFHLAKRRGFKECLKDTARLSDADKTAPKKQDKDKAEEKKMLGAISTLKADFEKSGALTVGHFLISKVKNESSARLRNQTGDYQHTITRCMAEKEARTIIERQRAKGWILSNEFEAAYIKLAFEQRSLKSVYHLVGECRFENAKRAAKASHSAELFILWSRLNNLRIKMDDSTDGRELSSEEKLEVLAAAYQTKSGVTFAALRKVIQKISPGGDDVFFNLVNYNTTPKKGKGDVEHAAQVFEKVISAEKSKDKIRAEAEKINFVKIPAWHEIKNAIGDTTEPWMRIKGDRALLDKIGAIITRFPNDEDALKELAKVLKPIDFEDTAIKKLAALEGSTFKGYIDLSLKALDKILPHMENGERYDQAASRVYASHSQVKNKGLKLLPPIKELRNPVVHRAVSQARKVLNAIIIRYGLPDRIHIEVTRDLAKNSKERQKYNNAQGEYLAYLKDMKKHAAKLFKCDENELHKENRLLKYRLWQEQGGRCLYSDTAIPVELLRDSNMVEIDHALPYRRSYDDSYKNKVLVLTGQNRDKDDKTPYEFLNPKGLWEKFQAHLWSLPSISVTKKKHLSTEDLDSALNKFKARNLVDTGYIARTLKNHIENNLAPSLDTPPKSKWVQTRPGPLTALLRGRWGLDKNRDESPRHHALDAAVLAASTEWMVQQAASWRREPEKAKRTFCPKPWATFRDDLLAAKDAKDIPTGKIFVSRRPERKFRGALHEDTIKSCRLSEDGTTKIIKRIKLSNLSPDNLERLIDKDGRNKELYRALKERLEEYNNKPDKAFAEQLAFYHPARNGLGPRIYSVKIETTDKPEVSYPKWHSTTKGAARHGDASRGQSTVRVDVFEKNGKFYLVPIFVSDLPSGGLPTKCVTRGKERKDWDEIDGTFSFKFSLQTNDYVVLTAHAKGVVGYGYYRSAHIGDGRITLRYPDAVKDEDKRNMCLATKTLKSFQKYAVNIFGELTEIKSETRQGLPDLKKKAKRSSGGSHGMANRSGGKSGQTEP